MPRKAVPCYFLEETKQVALSLRRFQYADANPPTCLNGYHSASVRILDAEARWEPQGVNGRQPCLLPREEEIPHHDSRWPLQCEHCSYLFQDSDEWQLNQSLIYRRVGTGDRMLLEEAGPGAMWYADWMLTEDSPRWRGPDGHCLIVKVPGKNPRGHEWMVDGVANNCGMLGDLIHKCWVRHGDPRTEPVTVDKAGFTCNAGAGSILVPGWHGFLRNGELVEA